MNRQNYKNQVNLLLTALPEVAKETCFALHGGTAINLFIRNMPRLSVDLDLTYVPIEEREISFKRINEALIRIKKNVASKLPAVYISHQSEALKLILSTHNGTIKLEVNQIKRGLIEQPVEAVLCEKAQLEFDAFCTMPLVPMGQLYGGKICAALARQHQRD